MDRLRIIAPDLVAWLDVAASGEPERAASGGARVSPSACAFHGSPRQLRLHGQGKAILPDDDEWDIAAAPFAVVTGARATS